MCVISVHIFVIIHLTDVLLYKNKGMCFEGVWISQRAGFRTFNISTLEEW